MGKEKFKEGLIELGFPIEDSNDDWLKVSRYKIEDGRFKDQIIELAFQVPVDFPINPPHGPHMRPRLFPINEGSPSHTERMHKSPLGSDWGHLSRPFPNWGKGKRTTKRYMEYIYYLFNNL